MRRTALVLAAVLALAGCADPARNDPPAAGPSSAAAETASIVFPFIIIIDFVVFRLSVMPQILRHANVLN